MGEYERGFRERIKANLVETFLTPYMEAATKTNRLGKTPLDILMETNSELSNFNIKSWRGVELLVEANIKEANKLFTKEKNVSSHVSSNWQESKPIMHILNASDLCCIPGFR